MGSEKVCVDTDAGADDAIALLLLFGAWDNNDTNYEVIAITCVNGNTGEDNVRQNVLRTLTVANKPNVITHFSQSIQKHEVRIYSIPIAK